MTKTKWGSNDDFIKYKKIKSNYITGDSMYTWQSAHDFLVPGFRI